MTIEVSTVGGIGLLIITLVFSSLIILTLLNRMDSNERRETREVLACFLAGYRASLFSREKGPGNEGSGKSEAGSTFLETPAAILDAKPDVEVF